MILVAGIYAAGGDLSTAEAQALALFMVSLFFATLSDSFSAVFIAYEEMEYPAGISTAIVVAKVALGGWCFCRPLTPASSAWLQSAW